MKSRLTAWHAICLHILRTRFHQCFSKKGSERVAIYLDHAATTKPAEEVIDAISDCLRNHYGNPSSLHRMGLDAEEVMTSARKAVASAIGTTISPDHPEVLFTSGATEASNLAIRGAAATYGRRSKHIITSAVEHSSVRSTMDALEAMGYTVTRVRPREDGAFYAEDFLAAVTPETCLVSMMRVENETGTMLPAAEVLRRVKKKNPKIITHCDCVQAFMKYPVSVDELHADLLSVSGHKIHGPKGIGALYIRKGIRLAPIVTGGKQERGLRPGTEAVPLAAGFGAAVRLMQPTMQERFEKVSVLHDTLVAMLRSMDDITLNSPENGSKYIVNFSVKGIRSETMLHFLESKEIYVSSGSACSKGAKSGVLAAYGISDDRADSAIRVSLDASNTAEELGILLDAVREGQQNLIHK